MPWLWQASERMHPPSTREIERFVAPPFGGVRPAARVVSKRIALAFVAGKAKSLSVGGGSAKGFVARRFICGWIGARGATARPDRFAPEDERRIRLRNS